MAVVSIKALIECDECANQFTVRLDPAYAPPAGWAVFDIAEDAVRGGLVEGESIFESSSVQGGKMLCVKCTRVADDNPSAIAKVTGHVSAPSVGMTRSGMNPESPAPTPPRSPQ